MLAKPFLLAQSNGAAAAEAMSQLLAVCLNSKQAHLPPLLADIIHVVQAEAAKAAIGMMVAVADCITANGSTAPNAAAKKQKDQKADQAHQQASAMTVMLEFASKGPGHQMVVMELFFCEVRAPDWQ